MDKDTVRIILLALGIVVIVGVYVWGRYKQNLLDFLQRGDYDELEYDPPTEDEPAAPVESTATVRPEEDEATFDSLNPAGRREPGASGAASDLDAAEAPRPEKPKPVKAGALGAPFLIQISVVAGRDRIFRGDDLRDALLEMDLVHGPMGIFHRYDRAYRETLFSVASLVEPGTFPMFMDSFECPGVVLFFQPAQVSNPLTVFDDLVGTCHELASRLGGIEWDETRQPLTPEKIARMRVLLEDACE